MKLITLVSTVFILLMGSISAHGQTERIKFAFFDIISTETYNLPSTGGLVYGVISYNTQNPSYFLEYANDMLVNFEYDQMLHVTDLTTENYGGIITIKVYPNTSVNTKVFEISGEGNAGVITVNLAGSTPPPDPDPDPTPTPDPNPQLSIPGNWILTRTYTRADNATRYQDITFYNGLGYPEQVINVGASSGGKNIVTPIVYDAMLRGDAKTYLPYASTNSTPLQESASLTAQANYYNALYGAASNGYSYLEKVYEPSSLNRPLQQYNAGSVFRDNGKKTTFGYAANAANEVFKLDVSGSTVTVGYYPAATLYKNTLTNEDGQTVITYTDLSGRTVLERKVASGINHDTYYGYNLLGQLAVVISPEGSASLSATAYPFSSQLICDFAYTYLYDGLGNVSEKKQPGKEAEYFVYDKAGRMVLYQDGNLCTSGRWIYQVYDNAGRLVEKNLVSCNQPWSVLNSGGYRDYYLNTYNNKYSNSASDHTGNLVPPAYSSVSFTFQASLERYRYGDSKYGGAAFAIPAELGFAADSYAPASANSPKTYGLKTYQRQAQLTGGGTSLPTQYVEQAYYYDNQGRVIQTVEKNALGGISRTSTRYDFVGNVLAVHESHQRSYGATPDTKLTTCTYDARGRLLTENTTLNSGTAATVTYGYDELGKLASKSYGNGVVENLAYTIQGWQISQTAKLNGSIFYQQQLSYYNPVKGSTPLYSGNISEWSTSHWGQVQNTYGFTYDPLGRLLQSNRYEGASTSPMATFTERGITYDRNGNITALQRYTSELADNFTYGYSGNKLTTLSGSVNASYTYDNNGNMTKDGRKNLDISYNLLNLPCVVSQSGSTKATYTYLADGSKVQVADASGNGFAYLGSLIYTKSGSGYTLESTGFSSGRIQNSSGTLTPYYYTTDHLGSVRLVTNNGGAVAEQNDYFPFGGKHTSGLPYSTLAANRYKFNGKEEQTVGGLSYLDYGARMYDNVLGRWMTQDPLGEKYYGISSYSYCNNNPVALIDPDGRDWYQSVGGEIMWRKSISDQYVDDYSQIWKNIGETYTHLREDGSSTFFYQKTNDAGELSLASHAFSANEMAGFGLFHSQDAREVGMLNHVNPTLGTFVNMVAQEMAAQWTDPYLLTAGAAVGLSSISSKNIPANYGARNAANGRKLNLQLASEEQMMSMGKQAIPLEKLWDAPRLAKQYGGSPSDWVKKTSNSHIYNGRQFETHWHENIKTGQRVEFKTKIIK